MVTKYEMTLAIAFLTMFFFSGQTDFVTISDPTAFANLFADSNTTFVLDGGSLPNATYNSFYYETVGLNDSDISYGMSIADGALPNGICLYAPMLPNLPWILAGAPIETGTFQVRFQAINNATAETTTGDYTLVVNTAGISLAPNTSPVEGKVDDGTAIYINGAGTIYYTTDGSTPTTSCAVYEEPLTIHGDMTIKAIAIRVGYDASPVATFQFQVNRHINYVIGNVNSGSSPYDSYAYVNGETVQIKEPLMVIRLGFSFQGWSLANDGSGVIYLPGETLTMGPGDITLFAVWKKNAAIFDGSMLTAGVYGTTYYQTVTAVDGSGNFTYRITSGGLPTGISGERSGTGFDFVLSGVPIETGTFTFVIEATDYYTADIVSAEFTIVVGTAGVANAPAAYPDDGIVNAGTVVYLNGTGTIYYTTDGSTPTTASSVYSDALVISSDIVVKTFIVRTGYEPSQVATYTYEVKRYIHYEAGSIDIGSAPYDGTYYVKNETVVLLGIANVIKLGYSFLGWSLDNGQPGNVHLPGETLTFTSDDITVYAVWAIQQVSMEDHAFPDATYNQPYDQTYGAENGSSGYAFEIIDGHLAEGLSLTTQHSDTVVMRLWGSPMELGTFSFKVRVTDLYNGSTDTADFTIAVDPLGILTPPESSLQSGIVEKGSVLVLTASSGSSIYYRINYGESTPYDRPIVIDDSITVTAIVSKPGYYDSAETSVSFVLNVHKVTYVTTVTESVVDETSYYKGESVCVLGIGSIAIPNQLFLGWSLLADGTGVLYHESDSILIGDSDITLYAEWTNATNLVRYFDHLLNVMLEVNIPYGESPAEVIPTRPGYSWNGWYLDVELTNQFLFPQVVNEDIDLFIKWSALDQILTFDSQGGSDVPALTQPTDSTVDEPSSPSKVGYTFAGWYADVDLTTPFVFSTMPTSNTIVYAKWTINQYAIHFVLNGGAEVSDINDDFGAQIDLPIPEKIGHWFQGWYVDEECMIPYEDSSIGAVDLVLYAKWGVNIYTVRFEGWTTVDVPYGDRLEKPDDPQRDGHVFGGWFADACLSKAYSFDDSVMDNVTLFPKWTMEIYEVTFRIDGGTLNMDQPVVYTIGGLVSLPVPTREGYTFLGWYSNEGCNGEKITEITEGTFGPITLYASWKRELPSLLYIGIGTFGTVFLGGLVGLFIRKRRFITAIAPDLDNSADEDEETEEEIDLTDGEDTYDPGETDAIVTATRMRPVRRSFSEKMKNATHEIIMRYRAVHDELLSHPEVRARIAFASENFRWKRHLIAKVTFNRKILKIHLIDVKQWIDAVAVIRNSGYLKVYRLVPITLRLENDLSLEEAKLLIDATVAEFRKRLHEPNSLLL